VEELAGVRTADGVVGGVQDHRDQHTLPPEWKIAAILTLAAMITSLARAPLLRP
jgi:hypothetical protein